MKKRRPKFIKVFFNDHHESEDTWAEPKKPEELAPARCEARGWLISENDEMIELSAVRPCDADDATWGRPFRIVKAAITFRSDKRALPPVAAAPTVGE